MLCETGSCRKQIGVPINKIKQTEMKQHLAEYSTAELSGIKKATINKIMQPTKLTTTSNIIHIIQYT